MITKASLTSAAAVLAFFVSDLATQAGAVVDGNVADVPADDNTAEGPDAAVVQGTSTGTADGDLQTLALNESEATDGDLSTQALAATGGDAGNGAAAAALMLGAGLTLITVERRKSLPNSSASVAVPADRAHQSTVSRNGHSNRRRRRGYCARANSGL